MNKKLILLLLTVLFSQKISISQDFLEVKYSINDITKQRNNFKREKIKFVTVKDESLETIYVIDDDGKILKKTVTGEISVEATYTYNDNNLISINARVGEDRNYKYDPNGNVISASDASSSNNYFYDINNRLIKVESYMESEEGEGVCGPDKINYEGDLLVEETYPCCMGFYERTVYEYSENNNLTKIIHYESNCSNNIEKIKNIEEYFYNINSSLPHKMTDEGKVLNYGNVIESSLETIFIYKYYD